MPERRRKHPEEYVDGRTAVARDLRAREANLRRAARADMDPAVLDDLVRSAAAISAACARYERDMGQGKGVDMGAYTQALHTKRALYRKLKLDVTAKKPAGKP